MYPLGHSQLESMQLPPFTQAGLQSVSMYVGELQLHI